MLNIAAIIDLLRDKDRKTPENVTRWQNLYYNLSLHIDGAAPSFELVRGGSKENYKPYNYFGSQYQRLFDVLLNKHPRESEKTRNWRFSQYRAITKTPFRKVIQTIMGAIFQDTGYSILIEDQEDEAYIWGNNFSIGPVDQRDYKDIVGYVVGNFQNICSDPNGFFYVIPKQPWYVTSTEKVEPDVFFVHTKDIIYTSPDEVIFYQDGYVWVINKIGYFRFKETGPKTNEFTHIDAAQGGYYAHMLNFIPIVIAGGEQNGQGYFDSWLDAGKEFANDLIGEKSSAQLVNKEASHPYIIAAAVDCPECDNGQIQVCNDCHRESDKCRCEAPKFSVANCDNCGGEGSISRNPGEWLTAPADQMDKPLIKIESPDIGINTFHKENIKDIYDNILRALHQHYIDSAQSGDAKDKDDETKYQFMVTIANDLFDRVITNLVKIILSLRNVVVYNGTLLPSAGNFTIIKPTEYKILTAAELLAEFDDATKAGLPDFVRGQQLIKYVDRQFGGDDIFRRKTSLVVQIDPLAVTSAANKLSAAMGGEIDMRDVQLSRRLPGILDDLLRKYGKDWFMNTDLQAIRDVVMTVFNETVPPPIIVRQEQP